MRADISNASLTLGKKIVLPNSGSQGKDSVDLIRDSLFSIQVKQPWLLLQYGNSDVESLGADRVERLLSTSPDENNGQEYKNGDTDIEHEQEEDGSQAVDGLCDGKVGVFPVFDFLHYDFFPVLPVVFVWTG